MKVKVIGPLPPFYEIPIHLWGEDVDCDSDGDSYDPDSTAWRELTLVKRPDYDQSIDIDPLESDRDILKMVATSQNLLDRTFSFLHSLGSVELLEN